MQTDSHLQVLFTPLWRLL